jgi:hypothetical protein
LWLSQESLTCFQQSAATIVFSEALLAGFDTLPGLKVGVFLPLGCIYIPLWVDSDVMLDPGKNMINGNSHISLDGLLLANHTIEGVAAAEVQKVD